MAQKLADAAIELARAGWRVFPVDAATKRPKVKHGHLAATNDVAWVESAWSNLFNNGGAIATPTGDGLLVIDVDPRNGGEVPRWAPATRTVRTQSGGLHLHYAIDEDIKSRAGLFGPGVDSKCRGGYVLLPPSPGYEWVLMVGLDDGREAAAAPRAKLSKAWLERHFDEQVVQGNSTNTRRLHPNEWRRGIIHDQVVAWAAYWAGQAENEGDVRALTWQMVEMAREAGCQIDNARGHIDTAINWVLARERAKRELGGPSLD